MTQPIYFIKFIDNRYLDQFLDGNLFMNTSRYFREGKENQSRFDHNEIITSSHPSKGATCTINGKSIGKLTGPIKFDNEVNDKINIFCLAALYADNFESNNGEIRLAKQFKDLGDKAVVIKASNIEPFISLVKSAYQEAINQNLILSIPDEPNYAQRVKYVSKEHHSGKMGPFLKFNEFAWQYEWRIAFIKNNPDNKPFTLKIDSINSICDVYSTDELLHSPLEAN